MRSARCFMKVLFRVQGGGMGAEAGAQGLRRCERLPAPGLGGCAAAARLCAALADRHGARQRATHALCSNTVPVRGSEMKASMATAWESFHAWCVM